MEKCIVDCNNLIIAWEAGTEKADFERILTENEGAKIAFYDTLESSLFVGGALIWSLC